MCNLFGCKDMIISWLWQPFWIFPFLYQNAPRWWLQTQLDVTTDRPQISNQQQKEWPLSCWTHHLRSSSSVVFLRCSHPPSSLNTPSTPKNWSTVTWVNVHHCCVAPFMCLSCLSDSITSNTAIVIKHKLTIVIFLKGYFQQWWLYAIYSQVGMFQWFFMFLSRRLESFAFPLYFSIGSSFDTVWRVASTLYV